MIRKYVMLIALVILAFPLAGALADAPDDVFCGDLSDADCQILLDNAAVMDEIESIGFSARFEIDMGVDGAGESFQMSGSGSGRLAFDADAAAALEDPLIYADGAAALIEAFFSSLAGEFTFDFSGETAEEAMSLQINMIIDGGVIALDGATLGALTGESMGELQWLGLDTAGLFDEMFADAGMDAEGMASIAALQEAEADVATIERQPDDLVNGAPVAVFLSSVDMNAVLSGMTVEDLLAEARPDQLEDVDTAFALMQGIDVKEFSMRQYIGLEDHYTHRVDMSMDIAMSGEVLGAEGFDTRITMLFDIYLSDFNEPFSVSIPEEAFVLPLAMFMQMSSQ